MPAFPIHFTVDEARDALPLLRSRLERVRTLVQAIRAHVGQAADIVRGNGHGPVVVASAPQREELQTLIGEIIADGIQIKDVERGLVDFPHFLGGCEDHEVFLCWHLGEDTVGYWHEIDAGYAGRQPL